ncbi:MAG: YkgJ family cysteine cluster protein [Methanomassiliicoccales archaeon]|nr:YkgJ family cysteine cluster protein [Methanomassiliicoccales archaeon]
MSSEFEVDLSELEGRRFDCIDGCELCCLCQPEVMAEEAPFFRKNHPERLVWIDDPYEHLTIATKEVGGPCTFLESGRCKVYDHRPRFCRQYPFHLYLGERLQVELDLSCRGVWLDRGEEAIAIARDLISTREKQLLQFLSQTGDVYAEFWTNCDIAGVVTDITHIRDTIENEIGKGLEISILARMLESSADEGEVELPLNAKALLNNEKLDLEIAVMESALASLESDSPYSAPVYCDPTGKWHIFVVREDGIHWQVMDRDGDLHYMDSIDPMSVSIVDSKLTRTSVLRDYLRTLNRRDSFLGYVCYLEDLYGYEDYLSNTYLGAFSTTALDLLWRTTLLGNVFGIIGEDLMREGVIYYDMDRLGAPTIGAFY